MGTLESVSAFLPSMETLGKVATAATAASTVAGAALPLFMQGDDIKVPQYTPTTAEDVEAEAAKKATERRRDIARRRGAQSTIRTPFGVRADFGVRKAAYRLE